MSKVWTHQLGRGVGNFFSKLTPAYANKKIYLADRSGLIESIDITNNKTIWRKKLFIDSATTGTQSSVLLSGGITLSGDHLLLGSERARLYYMSATDGSVLWQTEVAGEVVVSPVCAHQMIFIHTANGVLQVFDESSGKLRWQYKLSNPILSLRGESRPVVTESGIVFLGDKNGQLSAFSIEQGALLWQRRVSKMTGLSDIERINDVAASPIVDNNIVFVSGYQDGLKALSLRTGETIWETKISCAMDFLLLHGRIYLVTLDDSIVCIDASTGTELWCQNGLKHRRLTAPTLYDDYLVVVDLQGYLHGLNLQNGDLVMQQFIDDSGCYIAPTVADQYLLIQTRKGKLYAMINDQQLVNG